MVSRYMILSGIPLSRITICDEVQNMISYLVENLRPVDSNSISEEDRLSTAIKREPTKKGKENYFVFFLFLDKDDKHCNKNFSIPSKCKLCELDLKI